MKKFVVVSVVGLWLVSGSVLAPPAADSSWITQRKRVIERTTVDVGGDVKGAVTGIEDRIRHTKDLSAECSRRLRSGVTRRDVRDHDGDGIEGELVSMQRDAEQDIKQLYLEVDEASPLDVGLTDEEPSPFVSGEIPMSADARTLLGRAWRWAEKHPMTPNEVARMRKFKAAGHDQKTAKILALHNHKDIPAVVSAYLGLRAVQIVLQREMPILYEKLGVLKAALKAAPAAVASTARRAYSAVTEEHAKAGSWWGAARGMAARTGGWLWRKADETGQALIDHVVPVVGEGVGRGVDAVASRVKKATDVDYIPSDTISM